ncbi:condensation domain-containing protein [Streptomyces sp. MP131-18]|uniref:condensation domain-containing protein n=1 Tax=Streptomyces sp. MP131-18 TaxID=1857892 RepID=UPI00097BFE1C|nr:condensation domain-containing protein [Streptomyces sp. MP131-18]ONK12095.1 SL659 acyltransferase papA1 [Streptomyces sp. MP131-18]
MLMTPITEYSPAPGELTEFLIPEGALRAAAAAPEHPAPPSYVQENHLWRQLANRAAGREQSPWLGVVFDLPGRLDTRAMAAALATWVRRHPTLLTWFSADPATRTIRRHAVPPEVLAVEPVSRGHHTSSALREWMQERFDSATDPLAWPPFVAGAVLGEGPEARSTVHLAIDHCHTDGYSVLLVFQELRALYEAELSGTPAKLPETGSYVDYCTLDRERAALLDTDAPEVARWRSFFLAGPPRTFPLELGIEPGRTYPSVPVEMDLFDATEAEAFAQACKEHGAGFIGGLHAAIGLAGHELGGRASYRGLTVVHTRNERRWLRSQGWFINLAPVEFPVAEDGESAASFSQVVGHAQAAFGEAQGLAGVSPVRVVELTPGLTVQADDSAVLPMVSYMDFRHIPGSKDWAEADCNALVGPNRSADVSLWINRLWDRVYLKTHYPDTPIARTTVPRFLTHLRATLREIARTGDYRSGGPPAGTA